MVEIIKKFFVLLDGDSIELTAEDAEIVNASVTLEDEHGIMVESRPPTEEEKEQRLREILDK